MSQKDSLILPLTRYFISLMIFVTCCAANSEMSIDEAYKAIPHKRTVFDSKISTINSKDKDLLIKSFALVETAIVCKVEMGKAYSTGNYSKNSCYPKIIEDWKKLDHIEAIKSYFSLILESIQDHEKYFLRWKKEKKAPDYQLEIQVSHGKLVSAYNVLMTYYNQEPPFNKAAFFDYLCALDFI